MAKPKPARRKKTAQAQVVNQGARKSSDSSTSRDRQSNDSGRAFDRPRSRVFAIVGVSLLMAIAGLALVYQFTVPAEINQDSSAAIVDVADEPRVNDAAAEQSDEVDPSSFADGHERMVHLLARVAERAAFNNDYFQTASIDEMKRRLENAKQFGILEDEFSLNWELGNTYLNHGRNEEALQHLTIVYRMASRVTSAMTPQQMKEQLTPVLLDLAVAHLRVGETANCIHCQTGESCILPIRGEGVHSQKEGSREAIKYLTRILQIDPNNLTAAWLLNVAYMTLGTHDELQSTAYYIDPGKFGIPTGEFPEFIDIAKDAGLAGFTSCSGGSSADDYDNDGDYDLIVSNWDVNGELKVFLNNADGTFTDFSEEAGVKGILGGLNLIHADYDNDGDIDLYVLRGAWQAEIGKIPNSLLQNDGSCRFRDVTFEAGLGDEHFPTQTAGFADYDNDGDLDLFVGHENYPSALFENDGTGHFTDVGARAGVTDCGYPKGLDWGDYNNDRWPDIYVSNIAGANKLFHNNGDGTFDEVASELNVTKPDTSLPTWFWDYNNDGNLDIYASSYRAGVKYVAAEHFGRTLPDEYYHRIYRGDGKGGFEDKTEELGLKTVVQPMGSNYGDIDDDGYHDFYLGTGYTQFHGLMPNRLLHNLGGEKFEDVTIAARVGHLQKGHGVVFADFDRDGDRDLFIEMGGAFPGDAFRNTLFDNPGFGNNFIELKLEGVQSNRSAIGARISVDIIENGKPRTIRRYVKTGGSFGASPLEQHIGIGVSETITRVQVYWPTSDTTQTFEGLQVRGRYLIREGVSQAMEYNPAAE